MTEDSKQQANLAVNVLRKLLYQEHGWAEGWAEPSDPLVYDDEVMQIQIQRKKDLIERAHKEHIQYAKKHNLEIPVKETEDILQDQCEVNVQKLLDLISDIGLLVVTLSQPNAMAKDIDECLSTNEKLYNLPEVLDYILSITISGTFKVTQEREDLKRFCDVFIIGMIVVVQYLFDEEFRKNENKENTDSDEEKMIDVLQIDEDDIGINTSNLKVGQVVKNYKELCALLEEEVKTGKSKQLQLDNLKRFFEWEKAGQKFIITDIYDTPLPKVDGRSSGNNSKYVRCIELLLLRYLLDKKDYTATLTKRNWWQILGMINNKYNQIERDKEKREELQKNNPILTSYEIKHFYQRSNKKLQQILFSALNSLSSRKLIEYEIETVIVKEDDKGKMRYEIATKYEKKAILKEERYILRYVMGYEKIIQVFCRFEQDKYYAKVNERLYELYKWQHYFKRIRIVYNQEYISDAINDIGSEIIREELNDKVVSALNNNAAHIYKKKTQEYDETTLKLFELYGTGQDISNIKLWKIPDVYIMAQELLTDELIRIGHSNIRMNPDEFVKMNQELDDLFLLE